MTQPVSLDDLKRAIDAVPIPPDDVKVNGMHWSHFVYAELKAEAWRTAFEWQLQFVSTIGDQYPEFMNGIELIREKLK